MATLILAHLNLHLYKMKSTITVKKTSSISEKC